MDALTTAAASGMKARLESLEMLANNIANQASPGYKADREFYTLYISPRALEDLDASMLPAPPVAPLIERGWTDFSQGSLSPTGNPLHLAFRGRGFFEVAGPQGPLYTRSGNFTLGARGRLETQEGYAVLDNTGKPVEIDMARPVEINAAGEIRQGGGVTATLKLVDFAQPEGLAKRHGTYFELSDPSQPARAAGGGLLQGSLEAANFAPAEAAIRIIGVMRQFEMLQKAILIHGEMNRRAEDVARAGG